MSLAARPEYRSAIFAARLCSARFALDTSTHGFASTSTYIGQRVVPASVRDCTHIEEMQRRRRPSPPTAASFPSASALSPFSGALLPRLPHRVYSASLLATNSRDWVSHLETGEFIIQVTDDMKFRRLQSSDEGSNLVWSSANYYPAVIHGPCY